MGQTHGQRVSAGEATAPSLPVDVGAGRGPAWLDATLARELPALVALRRRIHSHPELSRNEMATTRVVRDALATADIDARVLPGGTGLIADVVPASETAGAVASARPLPVIGLRADIDALPLQEDSGEPFASTVPGLAHACGHDVHTTVLVGTALALRAAPDLACRVRLMFQPAEEVMPGGSRDLLAAGAMHGVQRVYALHCDPRVPVGRVGVRVGPITSACDILELHVSGPGGHTSRPHLTADVVGALADVASRLPRLVEHALDPRAGALLVWGAVQAGQAPNVIPRDGMLRGTLRVMERAAWEDAEPVVTRLVAQLLAPMGVRHRLVYTRGVPPVVNDAGSVALLRDAVAEGVGADAVVEVEQSTGGEDFSLLSQIAPGALARLGVWDGVSPQTDLHSSSFRADERAIAVGVRTLVHTVRAAAAAAG